MATNFRKLFSFEELREAYIYGFMLHQSNPDANPHEKAEDFANRRFSRQDLPDSIKHIIETASYFAARTVNPASTTQTISSRTLVEIREMAIDFEEKFSNADSYVLDYNEAVALYYQENNPPVSFLQDLIKLCNDLRIYASEYIVAESAGRIIRFPSAIPLSGSEIVHVENGLFMTTQAVSGFGGRIHCRNLSIPLDALIKAATEIYNQEREQNQSCETPQV